MADRDSIDPARLKPAQLAAMLSHVGQEKFTAKDIEEHIGAGAPTNDDGTISLATFAAWLTKEIQ